MPDNLPAVVVTDEESGESVAITDEFKLTAREVHEEILLRDRETARHMLALGAALKRLKEERLYLALGFRSFAGYCEGFQMSRQVAYDRIAAAEVMPQLQAPEVVAPVRQVSYTNALLMAKAHPDDRQTVASQHDVSTMKKREVERLLADAKAARLEAEAAKTEAAAQKQRADAALLDNKDLGRRLDKLTHEKGALEDELQARPKVEVIKEVPVIRPDDKAREDNAKLREENAKLRAEQGRIGDMQAAADDLLSRKRTLQEENEAIQADNARLGNLQEEAFRVNKGIRELQDVVTRNRGLIETARGKEYGDWLDLDGIYATEQLLEAILRDFHRIAKECVRR